MGQRLLWERVSIHCLEMASYGNVFFLAVARMAGQGIVVASYSYNTETDLGGVKQVLEQPNMNMSPGKHYSFSVGQLAWHLIAGRNVVHSIYTNYYYYF